MFNSVTLEVSLKPFKETNDEYIRWVCAKIFRQWYPLIKDRKNVSVMLWTADGSEILDYSGDLDDSFEWCCLDCGYQTSGLYHSQCFQCHLSFPPSLLVSLLFS